MRAGAPGPNAMGTATPHSSSSKGGSVLSASKEYLCPPPYVPAPAAPAPASAAQVEGEAASDTPNSPDSTWSPHHTWSVLPRGLTLLRPGLTPPGYGTPRGSGETVHDTLLLPVMIFTVGSCRLPICRKAISSHKSSRLTYPLGMTVSHCSRSSSRQDREDHGSKWVAHSSPG